MFDHIYLFNHYNHLVATIFGDQEILYTGNNSLNSTWFFYSKTYQNKTQNNPLPLLPSLHSAPDGTSD